MRQPKQVRRRKQDIGQSIVKKVRHVYRVPMGLHQRAVYQYHLEAEYLDRNYKPAPGAKLQALRVAAAAPDSHLLEPVPLRIDSHSVGRDGGVVLTHRSAYSYTPKVACALTLIRDILARREQVAVFSAFNDPSDILSRYLTEAGIDHHILDGRVTQARRGVRSAAFNNGAFPITLAGIDSMAEGHNWNNVNNIILTSYTWAADKVVQAINRAHRLTSRRDVNLYVIICDQSADRVLEDSINEKTNASELAIDGQLLGESTQEKSLGELLREAARDFLGTQECPNEEELLHTWPALRQSLREAVKYWSPRSDRCPEPAAPIVPALPPAILPVPLTPSPLPSWRRLRSVA
jgi:SNF2 family DNA or RNA helicase